MRLVWTVKLAASAVAVVVVVLLWALAAGVTLLVPLAVAGAMTAVIVWWPRARYEHWSFALGPATLELRRGVLWRSETSVPYFRIQRVDIERGPVERRWGVAELRVRTAAHAGDARLPGIAETDAEDLRRTILTRASDDTTF